MPQSSLSSILSSPAVLLPLCLLVLVLLGGGSIVAGKTGSSHALDDALAEVNHTTTKLHYEDIGVMINNCVTTTDLPPVMPWHSHAAGHQLALTCADRVQQHFTSFVKVYPRFHQVYLAIARHDL